MRLLLFSAVVILIFCNGVHSERYVPGKPGAKWSETHAKVIRDKLIDLWDRKIEIVELFDFNSTKSLASHTSYLYDPERKLSTVDCDWKHSLCQTYWGQKRPRNIAFGEPKAIR